MAADDDTQPIAYSELIGSVSGAPWLVYREDNEPVNNVSPAK